MNSGQQSVGHPIDVATGTMYMTSEDVVVGGKVDLKWERRYSTALLSQPASPLGTGWTTRYFATLTQMPEGYQFVTSAGSLEYFEDPERRVEQGEVVRILGSFLELHKRSNQYFVTHWDPETGVVERFVFKQGASGRSWPLTSIENLTGQGIDLVRDTYGRLTIIRQRVEQRSLQLAYNEQSQIKSVSIVMPSGQPQLMAQYEYDLEGRLVTAYDALGHVSRYEYAEGGQITRERLKDGGGFFFRYDEEGRCIFTSGPDNYDAKSLRFLTNLGWTEVTNSLGYTTRYEWLPSGQVITEVDPLGGIKKTEYDEHARIVARTNANGDITKYAYDERGNLFKMTNALGLDYVFTFNDKHQPLTLTNPTGRVWKREYNAFNYLVAAEDPVGGQSSFSYDSNGKLIQANLNGVVIRWAFDARGTLLEGIGPEGNTTRYRHDELGRLIERVGPQGETTLYRYDPLDNLLEVVYPDETRTSYRYDAGGNLTQFTDPHGQTTRYRYGTCHRLLEVVDPQGATTNLEWGTEPNRLQAIINAKGERYSLAYNPAGRVVQVTGFDGSTFRYEHDAVGNRIARTNDLEERIAYEHDALGRIVEIVLSDGARATYTYDEAGRLSAAVNDNGDVRFERDELGRILEEVQGSHRVAYQYDRAGRLVQMKSSLAHQVDYTFDQRGLLSQLTADEVHQFTFTRNPNGIETERSLPGALQMYQSVDTMGRLLSQQVVAEQGREVASSDFLEDPLVQRSYQWDATRVSGIQEDRQGDTTYVYDAVGHLTKTLRTAGLEESFVYDVTGNLTFIQQGSVTEHLEYGQGNRLLRKGNTEYEYDAAGRLIHKKEQNSSGPFSEEKTWTYQWDALDQLREVTTPEGDIWTYQYDAFGRRISKKGPERAVEYVWDRDAILHEVEGETKLSTWIFDVHTFKPLGKLEKGSVYSVIPDHLGTPRELLDTRGEVVWSASYTSWGAIAAQQVTTIDCPIRFQGQWYDQESGLHYNRYRYYDPATARFICQDPIGLRGGLNLYRYGLNPINWIDPFGLDWNYVLTNPNATNPNNAYYSGQSTGSQSSVEYRHGNNVGDQDTRFSSTDNDRLIPITGNIDHETSRGLEQLVAEEHGTIIGRRTTNPETGVLEGSVRGNLQDPVNQSGDNAASRRQAALKFLRDNGFANTKELVADAIRRANEADEGGCDG